MNAKKTQKRAAGPPGGRTPRPAATAAILGSALERGGNLPLGEIPPKWRKHYRRLLALRARLETERSGLTSTASQPLETYSMDMADAATDEFEHNVALCELSAEQDALYEIEEALKRIGNGTYGICQLSGKPIPVARLNALPWTRFTSEAERQLELEGAVGHAHLGELRSVAGSLGEVEPGDEEPVLPSSDETLSQVATAPTNELSVSRPLKNAPKPSPAKRRHKRRPAR